MTTVTKLFDKNWVQPRGKDIEICGYYAGGKAYTEWSKILPATLRYLNTDGYMDQFIGTTKLVEGNIIYFGHLNYGTLPGVKVILPEGLVLPQSGLKKIEFVEYCGYTGRRASTKLPGSFHNIMHIGMSWELDQMLAWNNGSNDSFTYLGHFNDGVV